MRAAFASLLTCMSLPLLACADSGGASDSDAGTTQSPTNPSTPTTPTTSGDTPTTAASSTTSGASISASATGTDSTANVSASDTSADTEGPKFDVGVQPDVSGGTCGGGMGGMPEFSYIWVANSGQGTISKIDTQTLQEQGRYIVRPDSAGSPSRTSVNLSGDVAVANRMGGVTKVYADVADCGDTNGMPGLQTSNSATALPWGTEECVAWYTPFNFTTQRPVAWAPGTLNPVTCEYEDQKLWTAGGQNSVADSLIIHRLNGETNIVEDTDRKSVV